ncbi:MAG: hypothetical protein ACU843_02645 [Gammaproteobacteria bacterium]
MQQPVKEAKVDFSQFGGIWEGEYTSPATHRSGQVFLDLEASGEKAFGGIVMHAAESGSEGTNKVSYSEAKSSKTVPLSIEFVQAEEGKIQGIVAPYQDPMFDNNTMYATFEGKMEGKVMLGTFAVKIGDTGNYYSGTWWATKK